MLCFECLQLMNANTSLCSQLLCLCCGVVSTLLGVLLPPHLHHHPIVKLIVEFVLGCKFILNCQM